MRSVARYEKKNSISRYPCGGGINTTTVALRAVRGDGKGTQCPGVYLGRSVPGGYKYGDLALQVGGVSNETVE
jgi:hypothetical protein